MKTNKNRLPKQVERGLRAFKKGAYYRAHEHFEDAWRQTSGPEREFYRALLHISGGFFRLTQGKQQAAIKFFEHAWKWLSQFAPSYLGFDLKRLMEILVNIITEIKEQTPPEVIQKQHKTSIFTEIEEEIT